MSNDKDLTRQLVSVLQEMVNDYGYNRCDEKRLETIGEAKRLLDLAIKEIIEPASSTIVDIKAALGSSKTVMSVMREQIEQMRGLFPDEDDSIQNACDEHDEMERLINQLI